MGQAKLKGSLKERQAKAMADLRAKYPASVECCKCAASVTDIQPMNIKDTQGINHVGVAVCRHCAALTWVIDGTPEAIAKIHESIQKESGDEVEIIYTEK